jgi:hypothetical protein
MYLQWEDFIKNQSANPFAVFKTANGFGILSFRQTALILQVCISVCEKCPGGKYLKGIA